MATVTPGYTFTNDEVVTPAKLNSAATPSVAIADGEVTGSKIATDAVTSVKIATDAVTTAKIADGSVTAAKLASGALPVSIPSGAVMPFAMNSAPTGWLAANGSTVSRTTYAALFAAIGTTYGAGDGSATFHLPDLRGYFVRGAGTNSDGTAAGAFGDKQDDLIKNHTHIYTIYYDRNDTAYSGGIGGGLYGSRTTSGTTGGVTGGTETRPKNIALLYCIKF